MRNIWHSKAETETLWPCLLYTSTPLGRNIGNSLEVIEAVETLRGKGPADLTEVCLSLASGMLWLAGRGGAAACRAMAEDALRSGAALAKLRAMVAAQGGDLSLIHI